MGRAYIDVTSELVKKAMKLPEGTILVDIKYYPWRDELSILLEHDSIPAVPEGYATPKATLMVKRLASGKVESEYKFLNTDKS
jgi:hypothetical protein